MSKTKSNLQSLLIVIIVVAFMVSKATQNRMATLESACFSSWAHIQSVLKNQVEMDVFISQDLDHPGAIQNATEKKAKFESFRTAKTTNSIQKGLQLWTQIQKDRETYFPSTPNTRQKRLIQHVHKLNKNIESELQQYQENVDIYQKYSHTFWAKWLADSPQSFPSVSTQKKISS